MDGSDLQNKQQVRFLHLFAIGQRILSDFFGKEISASILRINSVFRDSLCFSDFPCFLYLECILSFISNVPLLFIFFVLDALIEKIPMYPLIFPQCMRIFQMIGKIYHFMQNLLPSKNRAGDFSGMLRECPPHFFANAPSFSKSRDFFTYLFYIFKNNRGNLRFLLKFIIYCIA